MSELSTIPGMDEKARKRQVVTFAWWAIREILDEQKTAAFAELTSAQRAGLTISPAAAKLTALEDISFAFSQLLLKDQNSHG